MKEIWGFYGDLKKSYKEGESLPPASSRSGADRPSVDPGHDHLWGGSQRAYQGVEHRAYGNVTTIHADSCASMLVRMEDLLREEIKGTIPRLSMTIHLCVHLTATKNGPIVDEVLPTADMIQEHRLEFLRSGVRSS
jgi:hypothetical protein